MSPVAGVGLCFCRCFDWILFATPALLSEHTPYVTRPVTHALCHWAHVVAALFIPRYC